MIGVMGLIKKTFQLGIFGFLFSGCVTRLPTLPGVPEITASNYEDLVLKKTKKTEVYDGLYNKLTISATWLDSEMSQGELAHNARVSQWQEAKYKEEKEKVIAKHTVSTEFFVSFYTPERKHSDLSQNKNLWKLFLDVNGQRYEGKATKIKSMLSEVQALYPLHNRWSVPFIVIFPVATSAIENKPAVFTVTGPLGSAQLKF